MAMFETMVVDLKLRNVSPRTIEAYLYWNKKFIEFIKKEPKCVTNSDVKGFLLHLHVKQRSPRTIRLCIAALKFYYEKILRRNVMKNVCRPKVPKKLVEVVSRNDVIRMVDLTLNIKHKLLISLLYSSGLRVSEVVNLRHSDLLIERKLLIVRAGKGNKDRFVILSLHFIELYNLCVDGGLFTNFDGFVFVNRTTGGKISPRTVEMVLKNAALKAGVSNRVFPHKLRASFATSLLDNGTEIGLISSLLGHSSVDTTRSAYIRMKTSHITEIKSPID